MYLSDINVPQIYVLEATSDTGVNEAVAVFELQVTVLTVANSACLLSAPDTRRTTLPLQLDEAVKVIVTPLMLVPLLETAVHNFPTEVPAGEVTRYTFAHSLPAEVVLLVDGLAEVVLLVDTVAAAVFDALGLAEASAAVAAQIEDACLEAAGATPMPRPIATSRAAARTAPLPRMRPRMESSFLEMLPEARGSGIFGWLPHDHDGAPSDLPLSFISGRQESAAS